MRSLVSRRFSIARSTLATLIAATAVPSVVMAADAEGTPNPLGWQPDLAVFTAVVFLMLLAFLSYFAWGPLMRGLEKREQGIADDIDNARKDREAAELRLKEYETKLAQAETEIATLHADAKRDVEKMRERIVAEAKEAAESERRRAIADIESARKNALDELTQKSVDMAMQIASRVTRKEIGPDQHANLIREALDRFPASGPPSSN